MDDPRGQSSRAHPDATLYPTANETHNSRAFFKSLKSFRSRFPRLPGDTPDLLLPSIQGERLPSRGSATFSKVPFPAYPSIARASTSPVLSHVSSASAAQAVPTILPHHVLEFTYCGEDFTYDLETLEDDPRPVIELLKATLSERGSWMTVGAHYRRSGNAYAAISVVENMIAFMTEQGFSENDLKPAFILLSGCETDLAKRAKTAQPNNAEEHYKKSDAWLQRVYGKLEGETIPKDKKSVILSNTQHPRAQYGPKTCTHEDPLHTPKYSAIPSEESAREIRLEREIQSLLDERKQQSLALAETRAAKRKLEEDFMYECDGRRRLLREYNGLQKELATARKMEDYALSQVKREVETRRKAEENARTEKSMRLEIQALFEQCAAPPLTGIVNTMKTDKRRLPASPTTTSKAALVS